MSAHESMEQAEHAEHASGENRKIALLIAVIALFLALSETLGKGAQTESISKNVEASNLWAFFQAKSIRRTVVQATSDQARLSLGVMGDDAAKAALQKQIDEWIGIVLASATIITGIIALAWIAGLLAAAGVVITALGIFAPHALHLAL
jgi:hypothetical protein